MSSDMKDTPIIDRKAIDRLKRLKRRRDFLQSRAADGDANGRELSFDKGELSALEWAVEVIETTQALIKRETDKAHQEGYKKGYLDAGIAEIVSTEKARVAVEAQLKQQQTNGDEG